MPLKVKEEAFSDVDGAYLRRCVLCQLRIQLNTWTRVAFVIPVDPALKYFHYTLTLAAKNKGAARVGHPL